MKAFPKKKMPSHFGKIFSCTDEKMFNINLNLKRAENDVSGQIQEWWTVNQTEPGPILKTSPKQMYNGLEVYVFSDQVSPPSLGFLAGYG